MPTETALQKYSEEAQEAHDLTLALKVETPVQYNNAAEILREVKRTRKEIEAERVKITQPLHKAWQNANSLFKRIDAKYSKAESELKTKMAEFQELERARENKALAEFAEGNTSALTLVDQSATQAQGISVKTQYFWEVEDQSQIPDEFWALDEKRISAYVRTMHGVAPPGIKVVPKLTIAARAA